MPQGSTFTDWQQVEEESRLLMNEDFSWSEPPQRRRRRITEPSSYEPLADPGFEVEVAEVGTWDQPTAEHSHFDEMMEQWSAAYGDSLEGALDPSDSAIEAPAAGTRRTVVITGRGDERYVPAPRRRRTAELRFHERSTFSPDRAGLWAVLLGIALVIGAIAH